MSFINFSFVLFAHHALPGTALTRRRGTPGYMAPELCTGSSVTTRVGPAADVYSFGVLMVSLFVGVLDWGVPLPRARALLAVRLCQLSVMNVVPTVPAVPRFAWLRLLVQGCTAYNPEQRWSMADVGRYLELSPAGGSQAQGADVSTPATPNTVLAGVATNDDAGIAVLASGPVPPGDGPPVCPGTVAVEQPLAEVYDSTAHSYGFIPTPTLGDEDHSQLSQGHGPRSLYVRESTHGFDSGSSLSPSALGRILARRPVSRLVGASGLGTVQSGTGSYLYIDTGPADPVDSESD